VQGAFVPSKLAAAVLLLAGLVQLAGPAPTQSPFIVQPYLQLGDLSSLSSVEPVRVLWQAPNDRDVKWTVDVRQSEADPWRSAVAVEGRVVPGETPYRLFNVALTRLQPGAEFDYRVSKDGVVVFSARGKSRSAIDQPYRFAVTGDTGADTPQERRVGHQICRKSPPDADVEPSRPFLHSRVRGSVRSPLGRPIIERSVLTKHNRASAL
jgi:hypothetical protein